jgi:NAD(P)-dependent dehydrogenase (short-subunit alcohol dehydrogenase family)
VTGASRGLGRAVALDLAARGFEVIAGVREPAGAAELVEVARGLKGSMSLQVLDMCDLGDYLPPAGLRVLVNNAGFRGRYLPVEEADLDEWRKTFETNFFGVLGLTQRAIPRLREAGGGVICNIGSAGAFMPLPFYSTYRTSKAALAALSEGLRIELAPFGIRVIEIPIGGVDTDMLRTGIAVRPPEAIEYELYRPMAERQMAATRRAQTNALSPEAAARNVVDAILTDEGPMRRACDPNATAILANVAASSDEARMLGMMQMFGIGAPARA